MNAFLAGIVACAAITIGAWYVMTHQLDYSASQVYSSANGTVRLD
ncbi:hypothetical protein [Roseibium aquae]|nr:hypothetical protein [Roseibium aquae]